MQNNRRFLQGTEPADQLPMMAKFVFIEPNQRLALNSQAPRVGGFLLRFDYNQVIPVPLTPFTVP
jgi:hypothetical protein